MAIFCCPVCRGPLLDVGAACRCENGHSFDKAKSGYLNLLLPDARHSHNPGDDKLMVNARRGFLGQGYYEPFLQAVCRTAAGLLEKNAGPAVLDVGCGEGYYTKGLWEQFEEMGNKPRIAGIDISKAAVQKAAKRVPKASFAVASAFRLPVPDKACEMAINLFAPLCESEVLRVLKPGGWFLLGIPDREHLWELKRAVYDEPYYNEGKDSALPGFTLYQELPVGFELHIGCSEDIRNLFQMTPYYYKTSRRDQERLLALDELNVKARFRILVYQAGKTR